MSFVFGSHGIAITIEGRAALLDQVRSALRAGRGFAIATLNLDHLVKMRRSKDFAEAYAQHSFVVADGRPVVWLSHLSGNPIELAPGSDLVVPLTRLSAETGAKVALVGSTDEVLQSTGDALAEIAPGLTIGPKISPAFGFDPTGEEAQDILKELNDSGAQMCFLALGAPKQEQFAALGRKLAPRVGFVSVGAGLDFIAGSQTRAPAWVRAIAMEWLWRALCSPVRMVPRYARCFAILPGLTLRALYTRFSG